MTQEHPHYENYPPTTADADPATHPNPTDGPPPPGWMLPGPAPTPPPSQGPSRRLLLGGVVGVGLLAAPILWGLARQADSTDPDPYESAAAEPDDQEDTESYDLDGFDVEVPDGWSVVSSTDHRLVIRQGGNAVTFLHYAAGQDASAADEAAQQLRRYAADVRKAGTVTSTTDTTDAIESADAVLSGEVDGAPVDVRSSVRIDTSDDDYAAAAVVSVILTKAATDVRKQVTRMRRDFLDQLG